MLYTTVPSLALFFLARWVADRYITRKDPAVTVCSAFALSSGVMFGQGMGRGAPGFKTRFLRSLGSVRLMRLHSVRKEWVPKEQDPNYGSSRCNTPRPIPWPNITPDERAKAEHTVTAGSLRVM
jgi:hypothetical protein